MLRIIMICAALALAGCAAKVERLPTDQEVVAEMNLRCPKVPEGEIPSYCEQQFTLVRSLLLNIKDWGGSSEHNTWVFYNDMLAKFPRKREIRT